MPFYIIQDCPGEAPIYMGSADDVGGTDEEINAQLPNVPIGTFITTAGFGTMKQLGPDGWSQIGGEES